MKMGIKKVVNSVTYKKKITLVKRLHMTKCYKL